MKSKIKAQAKAKLVVEDHLEENMLMAKENQAAVEKNSMKALLYVQNSKRIGGSYRAKSFGKRKREYQATDVTPSKQDGRAGDLQIEDIHLKTKRINKLEGERFEIQSKYEILLARDKEREKILQEKNNIIRNLKQGMQLSMVGRNTDVNGRNESNTMVQSELRDYSNSQNFESHGQVSVSTGIADDANEVSAKLKQLKKNIEDSWLSIEIGKGQMVSVFFRALI